MELTLGNMIPGFFGGILGGVLINRISYLWQKRDEKKEEMNKSKVEYKKKLKAKLYIVAETLTNVQTSDSTNYDELKIDLTNFSKDLIAITAEDTENLNGEVYMEIQDIAIELRSLGNYFFALGDNLEDFDNRCESISNKIFNTIDLINNFLYDP